MGYASLTWPAVGCPRDGTLAVLGLGPMINDSGDPLGVNQFATHRLPLEDAPHGYKIFQSKADGCIKVILQP